MEDILQLLSESEIINDYEILSLQKENGELIIRWDNAPHHREIRTFPHHVHTKDGVKESYSITLDDALGKIKENIEKSAR